MEDRCLRDKGGVGGTGPQGEQGEPGAPGAGSGDVVGPASATDDRIATFDGVTGKLIQDGGETIAEVKAAVLSTVRDGVAGALDTLAEVATSLGTKALGATIITAGAGLTGGGDLSGNRTVDVGAGTGILANANDVAVDKASDANVRGAASNKVLTADLLESASTFVTLTETAGAVAVDWDTFVNGIVEINENTVISNPTNGQPGTWRTIYIYGNDATDRVVTFGNQFLGDVPTISNADNGRHYILMILCVNTSHFVVTSKRAFGAA